MPKRAVASLYQTKGYSELYANWHLRVVKATSYYLLGGAPADVLHPVRCSYLQVRILSIGHNFALLRFRNAVIQNAGYQVTTTKEAELVVKLASNQDFAAVVICSSIPAYLRETIAGDLKRLRPAIPLIIVCVDGEHDCFPGWAEEVVMVPPSGSQQALIDAIARVAGGPQGDQRKII